MCGRFSLFFFNEVLPDILIKNNYRFCVAGDISLVNSKPLTLAVDKLMTDTAPFNKGKFYVCINYDPIEELNSAIMSSESMDMETVLKNLYVKEPIDICLRTGFENRISAFLPLQNSYAELYFIKKYFPDIQISDLEEVINDFQNKHRRFGK